MLKIHVHCLDGDLTLNCGTMTGPAHWWLLQLCDSAFPMGAFVHSGGLESAWQQEEVREAEDAVGGCDLRNYLWAALENIANVQGPFVGEACRDPGLLGSLDERLDAILSGAIANRASRAQGQALAAVMGRIMASPNLAGTGSIAPEPPSLNAYASELRRCSRSIRAMPGHLASVLGAICGLLEFSDREAVGVFLYQASRAVLSAGVRLGLVGAIEAQALQWECASLMDGWVEMALGRDIHDVCTTAPLLELLQGQHDRLYSRLFTS